MVKQASGQTDNNKSNNTCRDDARAQVTITDTRCGAPVAMLREMGKRDMNINTSFGPVYILAL